MFIEFIEYYLPKAKYELIDRGERYYGEITALPGVWATGKTLEECRKNLIEVIEGWLIVRIKKNLSIPRVNVANFTKRVMLTHR